jgi:hypothetical protein
MSTFVVHDLKNLVAQLSLVGECGKAQGESGISGRYAIHAVAFAGQDAEPAA